MQNQPIKKRLITQGEMEPMLSNLNHIQGELDQAAGAVVAVEIRMRLIGQLCEPVREKLKEIVQKKRRIGSCDKCGRSEKKLSYKYEDCNLEPLGQAIEEVFCNYKEFDLGRFRILRNKFIHVAWVKLMKKLDIEPTGRQILSRSGDRNRLKSSDTKESILSFKRNEGFAKVRKEGAKMREILDTLLRSLADK